MKRIYSLIAVVAVIVLAASCQKSEQPAAFQGEEFVEVSFTIEATDVLTKTISDGKQADQLYYVVFKSDGSKTTMEATLNNITFPYNLQLKLAQGFTYKLFFFAQNTALQAYTVTTADGNSAILEADYSKVATGDEAADCFYAYKDITVNAGLNETVTLYRAVAQVNVGTTDFTEFAATAISDLSTVTVAYTDIPKKVQLLDGSVLETTGTTANVVFSAATCPMSDPDVLTVGTDTYKYLSMNYVLAPKPASTLFDAVYTFSAANQSVITTVSVPNVPVQMNHRTNILGQVLTGSVVFNIVIDETFDDPDYAVSL